MKYKQKANNMTVGSPFISVIILNVKILDSWIKKHRVGWEKQDLTICCLKETYFRSKDIHRLKVKGQKKILQVSYPYLYKTK